MYRFLIYVDDLGQKFPSLLGEYQRRVLTPNESPDGAFLQAFREHLTDMYHFWDPIPANCITLAAMDFINGCLLEEMPIIRDMKISKAAHSWPYYLRTKTGSASAYAFMLFPREINPDMSVYIQVIEDIALYTNLVNDILSYVFIVPWNGFIVDNSFARFYKEFLAGEKNNYIYNRAHVTGKSIADALQDTVSETLAAHARITQTLQFTDAYLPWKRFVNGYLYVFFIFFTFEFILIILFFIGPFILG